MSPCCNYFLKKTCENYKLHFDQTDPKMSEPKNDEILLGWDNPSCFDTSYEFSQTEDLELSEDCSLPGLSVAMLSAVIEQKSTGNIIDSPVPANVKKIITTSAEQQKSFLAMRTQQHSLS